MVHCGLKETVEGTCNMGDAYRRMVCSDDTSCAPRFEEYLQWSMMRTLSSRTAYYDRGICGCLERQHGKGFQRSYCCNFAIKTNKGNNFKTLPQRNFKLSFF